MESVDGSPPSAKRTSRSFRGPAGPAVTARTIIEATRGGSDRKSRAPAVEANAASRQGRTKAAVKFFMVGLLSNDDQIGQIKRDADPPCMIRAGEYGGRYARETPREWRASPRRRR